MNSTTVSETILPKRPPYGRRVSAGVAKKVTLRYTPSLSSIRFFSPFPRARRLLTVGARMHDACPSPDLTGTLSRYRRHTTFRRGYLRDAKKAVIAAAFRGGAMVTTAATAAATVAQLTDPRRIHLGPFGDGPRWALGTRARASALVLNALLSFAFASGSEQHARYAK